MKFGRVIIVTATAGAYSCSGDVSCISPHAAECLCLWLIPSSYLT